MKTKQKYENTVQLEGYALPRQNGVTLMHGRVNLLPGFTIGHHLFKSPK